ncbi:hypothetical protein ACQEVZ_03310 [Dactylosporangium sp. CA-152071]|uniref:hypothetical protein n=1 Tax=Dactylosporangium sp. CA-152071 TaxID=3239933 RepID=UPI003D8E7719
MLGRLPWRRRLKEADVRPHETSLNEFLDVDSERRESELVNGVPGTYAEWPRELLLRWRRALAQLRLVRSVTRQQGKEPPMLAAELAWVDDRWFELTIDGDSGTAFFLQTPGPARR